MKTGIAEVSEVGTEEELLVYLKANPDFFSRHPEVLAELRVPHACGDAVSLVEYQLQSLRDQSDGLRRRLAELVANARDNEELSDRLHRLTLRLLECRRLDEVLASLYESLGEDFTIDMSAVRLLARPADPADAGLGEFAEADHGGWKALRDVLAARRAECGPLEPETAGFLFGDRAAELGSAAVIPLEAPEPVGVLALGSRDADRFRSGMGMLFLSRLGELASRSVSAYLLPARMTQRP